MKIKYIAQSGAEITFDDYVDERDEYGTYYVEMCESCFKKYEKVLAGKENRGSACGTCSVEGCQNEADMYIDFNEDEIKEVENVMGVDLGDGKLVITDKESGNYPGVWITYVGKDGRETELLMIERDFELAPEDVRVHIFADTKADSPTMTYEFTANDLKEGAR